MRKAVRLSILLFLSLAAAASSLPQKIDELLATPAARNAFWGIRIVSLPNGKTLYEVNSDRLFVPASNTKLFTTSLALTRLGADFTFQTRVTAAGAPDSDGRIRGDLRLVGGGDPNLSARAIPYHKGPITGDPLSAIHDLADQIAAHGVRRIEGNIVGDDSWYAWEPYPPGWSIDDPEYDYGAPVSALTINDNTITLTVRPGFREGEPAALTLNPPREYYTIDNRVRTVAAGGERHIRFHRAPASFELQLWGTIPLHDSGEDLALGMEDPALYAAQALRDDLESRGIVVVGRAVSDHFLGEAAGFELAKRVSAPLVEDLRITDKVSQNLHAELALRAVGKARRNEGSRAAGLDEMKLFLTEIGIEPDSYSLNDGSGLSRANLVSPAAVVTLLRYMDGSPFNAAWLSLLPVGGQDGTLDKRFAESPDAARIHAKTGSLAHTSALSGYAQRKDGSRLAFSILVNNFNGHTAEVRTLMDRICILMLE